ncbi:MAG: AraC family transcriptional regulator, partial [Deltaproteobacteria bacterium]
LTLTFFQHELTVRGNYVFHILRETINLKDLRYFITEREFSSIVRMATDIFAQPFTLKEIHFTFPAPEYELSYQNYFHCPVYFNAQNHMLVYDKQYLNYPLPKSDPLMKKIYEKECKQLVKMYQDKKTTGDVVRQVIQFAGDDYQGIKEVARRLCMSSRTLRRKLTAEGISYQEIIDDIRKDNAIELLENTGDSIEIISEKIGYCNTSNFYHAFKRWTGQTPGKYRISKKSSAKSKTGANLNS